MPVDKERQAVIVGVGRFTQRPKPVEECVTPVGMFAEAARRAAADASAASGADALLADLVAVGCPMMFLEFRWSGAFGRGEQIYKNFPRSVAQELGADPAPELCWSSQHGGNGPQFMISSLAEMISEGTIAQGPILVGGVEENSTFDRAVRAGEKEKLLECGWGDAASGFTPDEDPVIVNMHESPEGDIHIERQTAMHVQGGAIHNYAMLENAQATATGRTATEHADVFADLFARFSTIGAAHPEHSWFPEARTKDWLLTPSKENRTIATPYNKWLCARDEIDQSASVLMMSWAEAERRGIPKTQLVFLHGSGDAFDVNSLAMREQYTESRSMQAAYTEAFRAAGLGDKPDGNKVAFFDIYSCFPIAVEAACKCVGLDCRTTDVSRLTQTGGLPYHGGPGSNYSCHGLCAVVEKLRTARYRGEMAVVGANGGMLTEHGVGIYSTAPPENTYSRRDYHDYAPDPDTPADGLRTSAEFAFNPSGSGKILMWTVLWDRTNAPTTGVIIGEMTDGPDAGKRFTANTRDNELGKSTIEWLLSGDRTDAAVVVASDPEPTRGVNYKCWFAKPGVGAASAAL